MASLGMMLESKDRYGLPTDPLWNPLERARDPGPGSYDPYPVLNPATHRMRSSNYFPDRELQYPGGSLYAQQPMWLSLPVKERNRFWMQHRDQLDARKLKKLEKVFLDWKGERGEKSSATTTGAGASGRSSSLNPRRFSYQANQISTEVLTNTMPGVGKPTQVQQMSRTVPARFFDPTMLTQAASSTSGGATSSQGMNFNSHGGSPKNHGGNMSAAVDIATMKKDGEFVLRKTAAELIYTNRDLPMSTFARAPTNVGNMPLLKRVISEPCYEQYDTNTSTLSFGERRGLQRKFRLTRGLSKIQRKVLESRKSVASIASLARDTAKKPGGRSEEPSWYIPPLPKEEGLGDMLANKSLKNYKIVSRSRDIEPNEPNQKDCIPTRWTGIGTRGDDWDL
mmetsp:Transcript_14326/g.35691  ORF Transcript_14326/g.35691 Transcript_14326/m.35691 type:complete len:395 (+) Transcript_14326:245-1429(+)|eukprot:g12139.t1